MNGINNITVEWRNKQIARKNLTFMREALNGEYRTLVKNSAKHLKGKTGLVTFKLVGSESKNTIELLLKMTGGKVITAPTEAQEEVEELDLVAA